MKTQVHDKKVRYLVPMAILSLAIIIAFGTTAVSAQTAHADQAKEQKSEDKVATAGAAGQQVASDAQSKKLRQPTPEEAKELSEALKKLRNRSTKNLKPTFLANGTVMVELPEEYMEVMVIKLDSDGNQSVECVTGAKAAEEALKSSKADAPPARNETNKSEASKNETGKAPQQNSQDKSKWEVK